MSPDPLTQPTTQTCPKCERGSMHYHTECSAPCPSAPDHEVEATYQSYGYWEGRCRRCGKRWSVDSSG